MCLPCLPLYLSRDLEAVQKRYNNIIMHIFSPYEDVLIKSRLSMLSERRNKVTNKVFTFIVKSPGYRLYMLLKPLNEWNCNLGRSSVLGLFSKPTDFVIVLLLIIPSRRNLFMFCFISFNFRFFLLHIHIVMFYVIYNILFVLYIYHHVIYLYCNFEF